MFLGELIIRDGQRSGEWVLHAPFVWQTDDERIVVPEGFRTDLASIPRLFQGLIPVNGRHRRAAVLHDYLYVVQDRSRSAADRLFLTAMESVGVRWSQRWVMYAAVRVGGWLPWLRSDRELRTDPRHWLARHGIEREELRTPPAEIDAIDV
ncbi:DUF1353 domain-containing protein [Pseudazoarcus pumilus]|uniref:DUF1353 domain-containing protein n=1 Tax=Pseudazoarcus pumilus TaxID=2067960 RepID=A0A2I6S803_9RHOO|nr:DUF1353 domain-containing protein [Pseudazoarcus pumilus]AUN95393.1 hypothetical protein C0099_10925 [Pseudazoarcus pumilus]